MYVPALVLVLWVVAGAYSSEEVDVIELPTPEPRNTSTNNAGLLEAAAKGDLMAVTSFLGHGTDIEFKDAENENTALHLASRHGHVDVVMYLLDNLANVEARNKWSATPLLLAAYGGHLPVVQYLVEHGSANVTAEKSVSNDTPLHFAAWQGHVDVVKYLLKKDAHIDPMRWNGSTPLHLASAQGHLEVVRFLVNYNADKDAKRNDGKTPLFEAFENNRSDVFNLLIREGADVNAAFNRTTMITQLIEKNDMDQVLKLIEYGSYLDDRRPYNEIGETPLMVAIRKNNTYLVDAILKSSSVDVNLRIPYSAEQTENSLSVLDVAAEAGFVELVKLLIKKGAVLDEYSTALCRAVYCRHFNIVKLLVVELGGMVDEEYCSEHPDYDPYGKFPVKCSGPSDDKSVIDAYLKAVREHRDLFPY